MERGNSAWKVRKRTRKNKTNIDGTDSRPASLPITTGWEQIQAGSTSKQNFTFYRPLTQYVTRNLMLIWKRMFGIFMLVDCYFPAVLTAAAAVWTSYTPKKKCHIINSRLWDIGHVTVWRVVRGWIHDVPHGNCHCHLPKAVGNCCLYHELSVHKRRDCQQGTNNDVVFVGICYSITLCYHINFATH